MTSTQTQITLTDAHRSTLLNLASQSIEHGLKHRMPLPITVEDHDEVLQRQRASFVTLTLAGKLRGCIGGLTATSPLVEDVVNHAYAAAFDDPRFPKLTASEFAGVGIELSILSPPEPMTFDSEADLLGKLRPGVDGLILQEYHCRGTFLPDVWKQLPEPRLFLSQLKRKAGLLDSYWSGSIRVWRYTTEKIEQDPS